MPEGKVVRIDYEKKYGFIKPDERSPDRHFKAKTVEPAEGGFLSLKVNDRVKFETRTETDPDTGQEKVTVTKVVPNGFKHGKGSGATNPANVTVTEVVPNGFNLPYRFAPIDLNLALADKPVWHDGSSADARYSGEILCSLEALTPLMPGNFHYKAAQLDRQKVELPKGWNPADDKNVVEPLRLASGQVLIAGSALKGMLRHSFAALVAGPMERVAERHYTYRTNLAYGNGKFECRPAVVRKSDGQQISVDILQGTDGVLFIRPIGDEEVAKQNPGEFVPTMSVFAKNSKSRKYERFVIEEDRWQYFPYKGGMDGTGSLMREFDRNKKAAKSNGSPNQSIPKVHQEALVKASVLKSAREQHNPVPIDAKVMERYQATQDLLASAQNEKVRQEIHYAKHLVDGQLIYVEVRIENGKPVEVVSLGHHHHYRWAYTSSVRKQNGQLRPELGLLKGEQVGGDAQDSLAAARGLFGYTHSKETPLGKEAYQRLAGRVAINHALSDGVPEFLNDDKNHWVALKVLGQPRPSAWEFYLKQYGSKPPTYEDESKPLTYGDTVDEEGGDLAGRKFYLHQPQCQPRDYEAEGESINSNQATLARYVVAPKAKFRFTVRFRDLRDWELGALLATLEPGRLAGRGQAYAHKLGLGRPLGLGSVALKVDQLNCWNGEQQLDPLSDEVQKQLLQAFTQKAETKGEGWQPHLTRWLALHRYQAVQNAAGYPGKEGEIYGWHTDLRRQYIKQRRAGTLANFDKKNELQQAHAIEHASDQTKASKP